MRSEEPDALKLQSVNYTLARPSDAEAIRELLSAEGLPYEDFSTHLKDFIIAKNLHEVVGCVGAEMLGEFGLLRSLVVNPSYRGSGIGKTLCERILERCRVVGVQEIFLLTTSAAPFFKRLGFVKLDRENVPLTVQSTEEFKILCPSTAICMKKILTPTPLVS